MSKMVFLTFCVWCLMSCGPKLPFQLQNATSTKWMAGKEDGINGTDYNVFLTIKPGWQPIFDSLWTEGKGMAVEMKMLNKTLMEVKGTVVERGNETMGAAPSVPAPRAYKGKGLLRFKVNNEVRFLEIKEINPTQPIYMP